MSDQHSRSLTPSNANIRTKIHLCRLGVGINKFYISRILFDKIKHNQPTKVCIFTTHLANHAVTGHNLLIATTGQLQALGIFQ